MALPDSAKPQVKNLKLWLKTKFSFWPYLGKAEKISYIFLVLFALTLPLAAVTAFNRGLIAIPEMFPVTPITPITPPGTITPTPTPIPPVSGCNAGCAADAYCARGFVCGTPCAPGKVCAQVLRCYNPACPYETTCVCPLTPTPTPTITACKQQGQSCNDTVSPTSGTRCCPGLICKVTPSATPIVGQGGTCQPAPTPTPTPPPESNLTPVVTTRFLRPALKGFYYKATITGTDQDANDTLSLSITDLPLGLTQGLCATAKNLLGRQIISCQIQGRPTRAGTYLVRATIKDNHGASTARTLVLTVFNLKFWERQ